MQPATIVAAGGSKCANGSNTEKKESKNKKVWESQDEDVKKESGAQRLRNEDDEIAILKGLMDDHPKRGVDPCSELSLFHEYMKNKIHADVSKKQLVNKIRNLKRKFQANAKRVNAMPAKPCSTTSILDGFLVSGNLSFPESAMDIVKEAMPLIGRSSKAKQLERRVKELQKEELSGGNKRKSRNGTVSGFL